MSGERKSILTIKNKRFCHEYLKDGIGTQAALRAGIGKGNPKSAQQRSSYLLSQPDIQAYLAKISKPKSEAMDLTITADRVLKELTRIAYSDPGRYFKVVNGKVVQKDITELTHDERAAISDIGTNGKGIKRHNKLDALDKLGKHLKLFTELHEQQHTFTVMGSVKIGGKEIIFNVGEKPTKT